MKRVITLFACMLLLSTTSWSQTEPDTSWKKGGFLGINFTQVNLSQWAQGGENSVALASSLNLFANYAKDKTEWANSLDLNYAMIKSGSAKFKKSDDRIEFNSKIGHKLTDKWLYGFLLNFKSQFTESFNYPDDSTVVSKLFAPAYLTLALGLTYKPVDYFEVFISPATGKITIVSDDKLNSFGAYGVDSGKTIKTEFGAYLNMKFKKDIAKNITLSTKLELFNNYTDKDKDNAKTIDVNWDVSLNMKVNEYITASVNTLLIYDANVVKRTQFREMIGVGLGIKLPKSK